MKPIRIQRRRTAGYKLPPNCISVTRPGKWGNPFKSIDGQVYVAEPSTGKRRTAWKMICPGDTERAIDLFTYIVTGKFQPGQEDFGIEDRDYDILIEHFLRFRSQDWSEIRGKNLACWCCLECACHADILLKYANDKTSKHGIQ